MNRSSDSASYVQQFMFPLHFRVNGGRGCLKLPDGLSVSHTDDGAPTMGEEVEEFSVEVCDTHSECR